jgi:small GTP-binding protein
MGSSQKEKKTRVMAKILLLGSFGVGKTSLLTRFIQKKFKRSVKPTIGADFLVKEVGIERPDGGQAAVICQIWDLAGHLHKMAKRLAQKFYFGAEGVFFCYDITRPLTLEDIR